METLNKQTDFFRELSARTGYTQKDLMDIYGKMVEMIVDSVNADTGGTTVLPGISRLNIVHYKPRLVYNYPLNTKIVMPAKNNITMTPLKSFKRQINAVEEEQYSMTNKKK